MNWKTLACALALTLVAWAAAAPDTARAQTPSTQPEISSQELIRKARKTSLGRELGSELMRLERSEATMGTKHPSRPIVEKRIAEIRNDLMTLVGAAAKGVPASTAANQLPSSRSESPSKGNSASRLASDGSSGAARATADELVSVIAALVRRIERLEQRVIRLERAVRQGELPPPAENP